MEFTVKKLVELLCIRQQNVDKALKHTPYQLKKIEGSTKKVKHYQYDDLPDRYKDILKEKGIDPEVKEESKPKIAPFTSIYLMATPGKQEKAQLKCKLVEFYHKRDSSLNQQKWLDKTLIQDLTFENLGRVSIKQLNDWIAKYNNAKAKGLNVVEAFIDTRGAKKGVKALSEEMKETAQRYFLKTSRPVIREVYRNMCHTFGDLMPSEDVLYSYYNEWKTKNPFLYEYSRNPDSAKNKYMPAWGNASEKAKYRNHYWELDSTPADVICEDGKRYAVLAAIDIYSRRAVFHIAEKSSSYTISQLLYKAILRFGIPENVVIDNGRDYTSNHFQSVCLNLGINMITVPPFSGDAKPHVERVFRRLSSELFEQIPGYIGHNVAQRSELQARKSFKHKLEAQERWRDEQKLRSDEEKKAFKDAWKIKKENLGLEIGVLFNSDELQNWIDKWTAKLYEQTIHKGINTKPITKWEKDLTPVQSISDKRMLAMLLGESFECTVGKKAIRLDGCHYQHIDLIEYAGQRVFVMLSEDLGYIYVFDSSFKFICIAEDTEYLGVNRAAAKAAKKRYRSIMKQMDQLMREAEAIEDVTILNRVDDAPEVQTTTPTIAVTKHTPTIDVVFENAPKIAAKDREQLESSNKYDFKNKDEEGKPKKLTPSGRPAFTSFYDRALWDLRNNMVDESTNKLAKKYPDIWRSAKKEYERSA
jgi:putative transposase